jgi:hypothetical protein
MIWIKRFVAGALALALSLGLILSLPMLKFWMEQKNAPQEMLKTQVSMKKLDLKQPEPKQSPKRTPQRMNSNQRSVKSGPRFGVDLGVVGSGGASLPTSLAVPSGGGGALGMSQGDVDQRPELRGGLPFELPRALRDKEQSALLSVSFCVDPAGKAYDVRILEERPSGAGLAEAGRQALSKASFNAARKDGRPVAFCGVEQEFEVKFND